MTTKTTVVVADAGPLIHLDELFALDVLCDYEAICVPNAVWIEVQHHRPQVLRQSNIKLIRHVVPVFSSQVKAMTALFSLHHGEREALSLCLSQTINILLTDDTAARLAAKNLNITTHGTLGLLIRAVRQKQRTPDEVLALLEAIPKQTTLHIRPSLLSEVIAQVKSEWE